MKRMWTEKLTEFLPYVKEGMLGDKVVEIPKAYQLGPEWQPPNYCAGCLKALPSYCAGCETTKKNNAKKVKGDTLEKMQEEQ